MAEDQTNIETSGGPQVVPVEQRDYKKERLARIQPYQFKKGQSGNPEGRPKGRTLKEYAQDMLAAMTDDERQTFLHGIDKRAIWELAEGKAKQDVDLKGEMTSKIISVDE